jgi:membrane protein
VEGLPGVSWLLAAIGWAGPVVTGIVLLAALYKLMPNTKVPFRAAVGGAVVAVPLWMLAEWGFSVYVGQVAGSSLYGTLGLLPLFLIWLNLTWLIFLFGAELSHTAVNLEGMRMAELAERTMLGPADLLAVALAVGGPFVRGEGATGVDKISATVKLPGVSLAKLLDRLTKAGVLCPVEAGESSAYVLARPAEGIPLAEVMSAGSAATEGRCDADLGEAVGRVRRRSEQAMAGVTLADVLAGGGEG